MRVLIATDGSDFSKAAIDKACEFVNPDNVTFRVVSVFEDAPPVMAEPGFVSAEYYQRHEDALNQLAISNNSEAEAQIRKRFVGKVFDISTDVLRGYPDQAIIEEATSWKADLIVVGSHGRGFWGRLIGSVSNGVVHHAPCSVLVVRKAAE